MSSFLTSIQNEILELEDEVARDPRIMKLQRLRELLALYESGDVSPLRGDAVGSSVMTGYATRKSPVRQPSETRLLAEKFSAEYVAGRTVPTPTRELYDMLISRGVEVGGKQPISNLSAILSKSDKFRPVGRAGWLPVNGGSGDAAAYNEPEIETLDEGWSEKIPAEEEDDL